MIICLKDISEKFFSFNVMAIPAGHSGTWAQKGYLALREHLGTWELGEESKRNRALEHLGHSST